MGSVTFPPDPEAHGGHARRRSSTTSFAQPRGQSRDGQRSSRGSRHSQGSEYSVGGEAGGGDPRLLCVLDVAYAKDRSDRIAIPVGADAALLAAVGVLFNILHMFK